ncbi:MAG: hypothetical protein Kow00121_48990 [Elainellaceae cyanobacterium]
MQVKNIELPIDQISEFCQQWKIREFSLFGSVLRDDFHEGSDIDVMIVFEPDIYPTLTDMVQMKAELKQVFNREVDLVTKADVEQSENYIRRQRILNSAQMIYSSGCCAASTSAAIADSLNPAERDEALLLDILIACCRIERYTSGVCWEEFQKDCTLLQDATVRQLEIIGEAVKHLSPTTQQMYTDIPWSLIIDVCDCLTCEDNQADAATIWHAVQNGVPKLLQRIKQLVPSEEQICSMC